MKSKIARQLSAIIETHKITFGKFLIIGALATIVNYSVFYLLYSLQMHYMLAATIGYCSGIVVGFIKNRTFTFNSNSTRMWRKIGLYIFVYLVSLVLGLGVLRACVNVLGFLPTMGNICSLVLTTVTNYLGCKYLVFEQDK